MNISDSFALSIIFSFFVVPVDAQAKWDEERKVCIIGSLTVLLEMDTEPSLTEMVVKAIKAQISMYICAYFAHDTHLLWTMRMVGWLVVLHSTTL